MNIHRRNSSHFCVFLGVFILSFAWPASVHGQQCSIAVFDYVFGYKAGIDSTLPFNLGFGGPSCQLGNIAILELPEYFDYNDSTHVFSRQTIPADSIGSSDSLQYVVYNAFGDVQGTASIVLTNINQDSTLSAVFDSLSWTENEGFNPFNQPISHWVTDDDYDPVVISDVEVLGGLASWIEYNNDGASLTISRPGDVSTDFNGLLEDTLRIFAPDGDHADTPIKLNINPIPDVDVAETLTVNFVEDTAGTTGAIDLEPSSNDYDTLNWTMSVPDELVGIVSMDTLTGAITFDPASSPNLCGQWTLEASVEASVEATNDNNDSASDDFMVDLTIECVNDAPTWNHFEISECEDTLLTFSFDELDGWGWFVDDSDEGFAGNGVAPGIDWSTLSTSAISLEFEGEWVTFHWPENNSSCCESLQTEWSFEVADFNNDTVTGMLNATIEPFDSAPVVTQVAMGQTIHDGDTTTITIAWTDDDSYQVLLEVTSQSAGLAVVPPANPIFNSSPIDLEIVVDSLVCGPQSISFQLWSYCDNGCDCGAETPGTTTRNFTVTLKDADDDGIPDHYPGEIVGLNSDSDNDGIPDKAEQQWPDATLSCTWTLVDSDGDGTPDFLDADSDNDNIPDSVEGGWFYDNGWLADADMDGDGERNHLDDDSDGDGILDSLEWGVEGFQNSDAWDSSDPDTTAAGTPLYDFLDTDSDNDSLPDSLEDENQNGDWEFPESNARHPDSDGDGMHDNDEAASIQAPWLGIAGTLSYPRVDRDSDDDGLPDALERDSLWDPYNPDTDGDCLLDGLEIGLVSSPALFDDADETFKRTSSSFELLCESCNLPICESCNRPTNRFDADAGTVTNPLSADTDGDGYADGFEDANLDGRVDGVDGDPGSGPLGGTSAPCPTCFSNDTIFCSDCTSGPHAGVVESDPREDCSPNCLVGTDCDCDGDSDQSDDPQEDFCTDLWQELCEATADVSLAPSELDSLIWSLLVPEPDSCSYFTVNGKSFEAKSYLVYYNATNDTNQLNLPLDVDDIPNACDNCNPGYHLGYKSGGEPYPAYSYSGGSNTINDTQDDSDGDSIGDLCDDCENAAGGIKGCTDWHACNYDPFAACDASTSLCTYTLPDLGQDSETLSVCANADQFDLLGALYDSLGVSMPNWRSDQWFALVIGDDYQEDSVQATANLNISIPEVLESNEDSCGTFVVQLTLNTPNDFSSWAEYHDDDDDDDDDFVDDSLLLLEGTQYGRFNKTGSEAKTITFFLQIDPAPEPSDASTSLCAGFDAAIELDNPFEPLPCDAVGSYQWSDVPVDWSISDSTAAQPTLNVPATFAAGSEQELQVSIEVGQCSATATYIVQAAEQSSISLTSAEDFQVADQTYQVDFCANTLDTLLFGVEVVEGNWQPGIDTMEVWTTTENESYIISVNDSTYSIDLPNLPVDATSQNTLTIYLQENPNCNADSVTVTFNKRAAPTIAWSEDLGDMLDICETAELDSISFHANSGATGFGWNHPSSGLTQAAIGEDNDQIWLPLGLDTLTYEDHAFTESLTLEIQAEDSFLGCAAARDILTIRVFEAPRVPQGANAFFRSPICTPFEETINDTLTPVNDSIGSVWNDEQFGITWDRSNFDGCSLTNGNVLASTENYVDSTRIEAYLEWNNNSTSDWRCANVYDTLVIRIGESPVAESIDWNLFPGEVDSLIDSLINVGDATCDSTAINFSLMPTDLDDPSSEAAAVGYRWWVNDDQMSVDTTFTFSVEDNATIKAAAIWTYTIDDVEFSCASDTIPEDIAVAPETACSSNPIIAYPGPAFLATALSNQNPVPDNYWVKWGYFSTDDAGTVTGAQFFVGLPAQGAALFYPTAAQVAQVDSVSNATNETLDQYIFALMSFYGADMKCPCLSLADGSVADGVVATGIEEWIDLEEVGFLVYPNPTTGRVFVEPPGGEPASEPLEAKIYNMTGREVFRTGLASYGSQILDISHLQNGIYVLRITSPTEVRHLQTLILTQY